MTEEPLHRVQQDLDTMKRAAGVDLSIGWADLWLTVGLIPASLFMAVWVWLVPWDHVVWCVAPFIPLFAALAYLRYEYRRGTGRSPQRRREYSFAIAIGVIMGMATLGLMLWARHVGVPREQYGAWALIGAGVVTLIISLSDRARYSGVGMAVVLLLWGGSAPWCTSRQILLVGAAAVTLGATITSAIMYWQLSRQVQYHAAD